jgi:hypothetical protein
MLFHKENIAKESIHSKSKLEIAKEAFTNNDCVLAIKILDNENTILQLNSEKDLLASYKILAICYYQNNKKNLAENQLENILSIKPNYFFDPFDTPAPVIDLFNKVKSRIKYKTEQLANAKQQALLDNSINNLVTEGKVELVQKEVIKTKNSKWLALLPFGVGHFINENYLKGSLIASGQAASLAGNIGFYWYKQTMIMPDNKNLVGNSQALQNYNVAQALQWSSLGLFAALYAYSIIDGLITSKATIREEIVYNSNDLAKQLLAKGK